MTGMRSFARLLALLGLVLVPLAARAQVARAPVDTGYVLGPDDSITAVVYGNTEFNVQTRIKPDGSISVPFVGKVQAAGNTVTTLADLLASRLNQGGYLKSPIVNVEITQYGSRFARVAGHVGTPGLIPLDRQYHALDVLLRAGWVREGGAAYVYLRHANNDKEQRLDSEQLARGSADQNPLVQPGDTLFVPDAELVYLYGQVNHPGPLALRPGMTLRQALASAGGVTASGSEKGVRLYRGKGAKEQPVGPDEVLQKDDVLVVKERLF